MLNISGVPRRPVVLIIMDGVGVNAGKQDNAVAEAKTPRLDACFARYPHALLGASGPAVGLPDGQMGNSGVAGVDARQRAVGAMRGNRDSRRLGRRRQRRVRSTATAADG